MPIDASAVARVVGIETTYQDMRAGGVLFLPQRVAVLAQGSTGLVYSSTKFTALSAADVGNRMGYGSPAHLAVRQLLPINGDGVGTVPVTIYPLQEAAGAAGASGDITPSGTQTQAASYRVRAGGVPSASFTIPKNATVAYIVGAMMQAIQAVLEMPITVVPAYGAVTGAAGTNAGNGTITALSLTGTPRSGVWTLKLVTAVANGGVFQLLDPDGTVVNSAVTMTPGAGGTTVINTAGIQFTLTDGTSDFAVGDTFNITVPATKLNVSTKWKGDSANAVTLSIDGTLYGVTFAFTQPTGAAGNPSVVSALAQIGNVWETIFVNCLNESDTTNLDAIQTVGEGRWGNTVRKPFVSICGQTAPLLADATAISSARRTDRINAHVVSPGTSDLPFVVAARAVARIASLANNSPVRDYGGQKLTGLNPGADSAQWDYPTRDAAVKLGSSTATVRDGVVVLGDVVTYYRPTGEDPPAYRYVCDIIKLQNIIYNVSLIFASDAWDGMALVPDNQPVVSPDARKPRDAVAAVNALIDNLGLLAFLSDPATAKKKTTGAIDSQNPKRLDVGLKVQLSGNSNVIDVALNYGFYFGAAA
jgi:phage tail sheath gpL-like